uniref:Fibropellin-1-like n=1 Tax=Saccoglossus kowalevskii TaxID=10224 RepID=A0ABM0M578_SACKO
MGGTCMSVLFSNVLYICEMYDRATEDIFSNNTLNRGWIAMNKPQTWKTHLSRDACASNPCNSNGWCVAVKEDNYRCTCRLKSGYTGQNCNVLVVVETYVDSWCEWTTWTDCSSTVAIGYRERSRHCIRGYDDATVETDGCQGLPVEFEKCYPAEAWSLEMFVPITGSGSVVNCQGSELSLSECETTVKWMTYTRYAGVACDFIDINECASNPCLNNGTCVDGVDSYVCNCVVGYSGDNCQTDINECASNPCLNNGTCVDGVNSYVCNCVDGYSGDNCQT